MILDQSLSLQYYEELLARTKSQQMSGKLIFKNASNQQWCLVFQLGRIIFASGGVHPIRRFYRQLQICCPDFQWEESGNQILDKVSSEITQIFGWDYECLRLWYEQQLLTREQVHQIASYMAVEVLFDIMHEGANNLEVEVSKQELKSNYFSLNDPIRLAQAARQLLCQWNPLYPELVRYTPNDAPVISDPEKLIENTSSATYKTLRQLLNGENTLRDLAAERKHSVVNVTHSLMPYIKSNWVELKQISDLPEPKISRLMNTSTALPSLDLPIPSIPEQQSEMLIACVDDSELVCLTMEKIFKSKGFKFISIQDSLRAIPRLLAQKPDLIFLDLVMPNTNGYEICSQLRQLSLFKKTPIVILTGNDGIVDRVRAKIVGATDFLSKPVDSHTVLAVTIKHIIAAKSQG